VFTVEGLSKQIENWRSISMISGLFLVVELVSDGRVIGDGGFESVDFENRTGEIGINLNDEPDIRGKGYAVEALETMLDYSFKELGLKSVKLWTLKVNKPLRGLLEKRLGLTPDANTGDTESCYTVEAHSWLKNATNMQ
jgi:RimJ/RimL family protein N-acetyltransferase